MNTEIDDERLKEWDTLQRLVNIAGCLNHGDGITAKIHQLEDMAFDLNRPEKQTLRTPFISWLNDLIREKIEQQRQEP